MLELGIKQAYAQDMSKAFAYLRVSGKGQVKGDGFPRQLEAIKGYAKAHGITVARVFEERGVCGASDLENRPALSELMEALHANGVRQVLIEKLDRLARDLMVQETIIGDLRRGGFELVSVMEPDLLEDQPTRKLMRQFMGAIAEYEKSMIVSKLRGARQRMKAKTGHCEGRKPYGFYPGEAQVIGHMKELKAAGLGFDRIAVQLNADGIKPRKGERWWGRGVNNVLHRIAR
jgi:DNA invertase Pin-like site-specific DNA recombinase